MSEINTLQNIQFRKKGKYRIKGQNGEYLWKDNSAWDSFFWSKEEEKFVNNLVGDMLSNNSIEDGLDEYLKTIVQLLHQSYKDCLNREKLFLQSLTLKTQFNSLNLIDYNNNLAYAKDFNEQIQKILYNNQKSLFIQMLQSDIYAELISEKISVFSSTMAAQIAGVEVNEVFMDLTDIFLVKDQGYSNKKSGTIKFTARDRRNPDIIIKKIIDFCDKYGMELIKDAIENELATNQTFINTLMDALSQTIIGNFQSTVRNINFKKSNIATKGVSKDLEKDLKNAFKEVQRIVFNNTQNKKIQYGTPIGPLTLNPSISQNEDGFQLQVTMKMFDNEKTNEVATDEPIKVLLEYLEKSIPQYCSAINIEKTDIMKDFKDNKNKIISVIQKNIEKQDKNKIQDQRKIISSFGYQQIRGLLGEIAAAISLHNINNNKISSVASITGSDMSASGQVNYDVVAKINNSTFGFQVKNYKVNTSQSYNLYSTQFTTSSKNNMEKYFGKEATKKYYFLFANEKMLKEVDLIDSNFDDKIITSFYKYTSNFLRITAGDLSDEVIGRSDAYFVADKIIPASFLLATLYKNLKKQLEKSKTNQLFKFQSRASNYETLELGKSSTANKIDMTRLGSQDIYFNGITINLNFKG